MCLLVLIIIIIIDPCDNKLAGAEGDVSFHLPLIQLALTCLGFSVSPVTSASVRRRPLMRLPSSAGDNRNMEKTIRPSTAAITNKAINIPRQFLWPGDVATSSWNEERAHETWVGQIDRPAIAITALWQRGSAAAAATGRPFTTRVG